MRIFPECYNCILRQTVTAVESNDVDQETQINTIKKVLSTLGELDGNLTPSAIAGETNRIIRESVGLDDLYREAKETSHQLAMGYLDDLRELLRCGSDRLEMGLKISAAGNIIDVIHTNDYDLWDEVINSVNQELKGEGIDVFREKIQHVSHLLFLADNVGETVFDRVLIESLELPVIYAVKGGPILNDATLKDAQAAGIHHLAQVVETGSQSPGTILNQCTEEFQDLFKNSPLVLSKGQANYETLVIQGDKVFYLLRVKCPVLGQVLKIPVGNLAFKQGKPKIF